MLKKILKITGVIVLCFIGVVFLFLGVVWASIEWGQYNKKQERIQYQKEVCDTMKVVNDKFTFEIIGFGKKELQQVHFYLVRDKKILQDSVVKTEANSDNSYLHILMPFEKFNTSDTVVLKAIDRYFVFSGLSYTAYQNYGMFGPVGPCECYLGTFEIMNGKAWDSQNGYLQRQDGLLNYQLPSK